MLRHRSVYSIRLDKWHTYQVTADQIGKILVMFKHANDPELDI